MELAVRILKHGFIASALLAFLGYGLGELAGMWIATQPPLQTEARLSAQNPTEETTPNVAPPPTKQIDRALRVDLPFRMAAWGFGLVVVCELFLTLTGRAKPPLPARPPVLPPKEADVEHLLNELLRRSEAEKIAAASTPCPVPMPAENTPVST